MSNITCHDVMQCTSKFRELTHLISHMPLKKKKRGGGHNKKDASRQEQERSRKQLLKEKARYMVIKMTASTAKHTLRKITYHKNTMYTCDRKTECHARQTSKESVHAMSRAV